MRGYAHKTDEGLRVVYAQGGHIIEAPDRLLDRFAARLADKANGLYRITVTAEGHHVYMNAGRRVASAEAEADRLDELADKNNGQARTGLPGIAGYQHMEDMATAAKQSARAANRGLARFLRSLAQD